MSYNVGASAACRCVASMVRFVISWSSSPENVPERVRDVICIAYVEETASLVMRLRLQLINRKCVSELLCGLDACMSSAAGALLGVACSGRDLVCYDVRGVHPPDIHPFFSPRSLFCFPFQRESGGITSRGKFWN